MGCLTILFFVVGYRYESWIYECPSCHSTKETEVTRLWFILLPFVSKESVQQERFLKSGHVHQWRGHGDRIEYSYKGCLGVINAN